MTCWQSSNRHSHFLFVDCIQLVLYLPMRCVFVFGLVLLLCFLPSSLFVVLVGMFCFLHLYLLWFMFLVWLLGFFIGRLLPLFLLLFCSSSFSCGSSISVIIAIVIIASNFCPSLYGWCFVQFHCSCFLGPPESIFLVSSGFCPCLVIFVIVIAVIPGLDSGFSVLALVVSCDACIFCDWCWVFVVFGHLGPSFPLLLF